MKLGSDAKVVVGDGVVTVKWPGASSAIVANILGTTDDGKSSSIFLDRLIHDIHEKQLGEYMVTGAVSSILTKENTTQ